jgi:hypothetical protein
MNDLAVPLRLVAALTLPTLMGCGSIFGTACPTEERPGIELAVFDASSGEPLPANGVIATATRDGRVTQFVDAMAMPDNNVLLAFVPMEGTYVVEVVRPGYEAWSDRGVVVGGDSCGPETTNVSASLVPE